MSQPVSISGAKNMKLTTGCGYEHKVMVIGRNCKNSAKGRKFFFIKCTMDDKLTIGGNGGTGDKSDTFTTVALLICFTLILFVAFRYASHFSGSRIL